MSHGTYRSSTDDDVTDPGDHFSLLPPENATGNWVKVVQRVPVKIVFDAPPDPSYPLGPRHVGGRDRASQVGCGEHTMADTELIRCPACGATNRIPREKLEQGRQPLCGRCRTPLPVAGKPVTVTDTTFAAEVERSPVPVVVDLWAAWCGPCRIIAPVIDELAATMAGRVRFAKLNIDENPATAARFNVRSIPTLLVLKGGHEVDRIVGVQPKSEIVRRLERVI